MTRKIVYLTGTRADFGLMLPTLQTIAARSRLEIEVVVTGMHLSSRYGLTVDEVRASGLTIGSLIPVDVDQDNGFAMAGAAAGVARGMADYIAQRRPHACLLLGDRWEMLATAMVAALAGVPIFHLCGGERSGSVDDSIRHSVSKLAHIHAVATSKSRDRLLAMGEEAWRIHVVGTPGLVGLNRLATFNRAQLAYKYSLKTDAPIALVLFHPVVQDADVAGSQMAAVLTAVNFKGFQIICLMPNSDAGSNAIREAIHSFDRIIAAIRIVTHLPRQIYISWLASADLLVGNSSSGIIEAASFGIPVINVGDRQVDRERNQNTIDCKPDIDSVVSAIEMIKKLSCAGDQNIYGDGLTDVRVADVIEDTTIDSKLLKKRLVY